jgi:hypothetical protein
MLPLVPGICHIHLQITLAWMPNVVKPIASLQISLERLKIVSLPFSRHDAAVDLLDSFMACSQQVLDTQTLTGFSKQQAVHFVVDSRSTETASAECVIW